MKKSGKILLIVAGVLAASFVVIMSVYGWDFSVFSSAHEYEIKQETLVNENQNIEIYDANVDILVGKSQDDNIHMIYYENSHHFYEKTLNGDISFKYQTSDAIYNSPPHFEILLPENYSGNLMLNTSNDDITLSDISYSDAQFVSSNGDVLLTDVSSQGKNEIITSNSDIEIETSSFAELSLQTSNDKIIVNGVKSEGDLEILCVNGDVSLKNTNAQKISVENENADIELDLVFGSNMQLHTTNGHIEGSVAGSEADFTYTTTTKNGDNNLGDSVKDNAQNTLNATTENGNIQIEFK